MDTANIFTDETDFNICKSWLCGSTDGATYSLSDCFGWKIIERPDGVPQNAYNNLVEGCFCTQEWEDAVGYKHDYKVDDPNLDLQAARMVKRIDAYIKKLNEKIRSLENEKPKSYCEKLGYDEEGFAAQILDAYGRAAVPSVYLTQIVDAIAEEVAEDVYTSTNLTDWNSEDVGLAVGRVLCKRLGIAV